MDYEGGVFMFVHETHSFYIIAKLGACKNAPAGYIEKKEAFLGKVLSNIGAERTLEIGGVWQLKDVMYASSDDIMDILSNEMIRLVSRDEGITASEKKLYELSTPNDKIVVSEFLSDNTSYIK